MSQWSEDMILKLPEKLKLKKKEAAEKESLNSLKNTVELDGIEPTTSGLQSPRSPN